MKEKSRRTIRVGEEIRHVLSEILRRDLSDPALELVSITEVDVTTDFSYAKVYVSSLGEDQHRETAVERLNELQGKIRHLVSQKTRIRHTPKMTFYPDETAARADQINRMLRDVLPEGSEQEPAGSDDDE